MRPDELLHSLSPELRHQAAASIMARSPCGTATNSRSLSVDGTRGLTDGQADQQAHGESLEDHTPT
jgi:hypothetical protein